MSWVAGEEKVIRPIDLLDCQQLWEDQGGFLVNHAQVYDRVANMRKRMDMDFMCQQNAEELMTVAGNIGSELYEYVEI